MKEKFIFSDWELTPSKVEMWLTTEGERTTEEGVERIKARIIFANDWVSPMLQMKRYDVNGEPVEDFACSIKPKPYDMFKTFEEQVKRMERGEVFEAVDQEK